MTTNTTLIMSQNKVNGFAEGPHGNGRVVVKQFETAKYNGNMEKISEQLFLEMLFTAAGSEQIDEVCLYLSASNDAKQTVSAAMVNAFAKMFGMEKIHILSCKCHKSTYEAFCKANKIPFTLCECGGADTLASVIQQKLGDVPAVQQVEKKPFAMTELLAIRPAKESSYSVDYFAELSVIGGKLIAGMSTGEFWLQDGEVWNKLALQTKQGVNVMYKDGESVLVGDGSCCCGGVWRIKPNGKAINLKPVEGQYEVQREVKCLLGNVYSFARYQGELLAGVGGCSGKHLYRLNKENMWEFHPLDPKEAVTAMVLAGDKLIVAFASGWGSSTIHEFDGITFKQIGRVSGGVPAMYAYKGQIFFGGTDGGSMRPTRFSNAEISVLKDGKIERLWKGEGGVQDFFEVDGVLYTFGEHQVTGVNEIRKSVGDKWVLIAKTENMIRSIIAFDGKIYAAGVAADKKTAMVWEVKL